jgi:large subunit ribosomal protein L9
MIEVILMERIERLGALGQVVKVKPGYARNFLLPQNKALRATSSNIAYFEQQRAILEAKNAEERAAAEAQAVKLSGLTIMLVRQASEAGQLFGSVTARDVAEGVTESGYPLERRLVEITAPIKNIGLFPVKIKLHAEVVVTITVNVARTEEEGRMQLERGKAAAAKPSEEIAAVSAEPDLASAPQPDAEEAPKPKKARKAKAAE